MNAVDAAHVITALQVVAAAVQVLGALLMANAYVHFMRKRQIPRVLASAVVRGDTARGAARLAAHLSAENRLATLQGLGLLAVGFVLQLAAAVVSLFG